MTPINNIQLGQEVFTNTYVARQHEMYKQPLDGPTHSQDLFISQEQATIDLTRLDGERWYAIEELKMKEENDRITTVQLLRPKWWLSENNISKSGDHIYLTMPEMALQGYATVTSINEFEIDEDPRKDLDQDYVLSPVTGIFERASNDVWNLIFDNRDTIGVTGGHPIFSLDAENWRLAGELLIGEQVLTQAGKATLLQKERRIGSYKVYNLEVRAWHNFLVGSSGVVVHNACKRADVLRLLNDPREIANLPAGPKREALEKLLEMKRIHRSQYDRFMGDDWPGGKMPLELGEGGVKAWEALFDLPGLRISTTKLKAVDDFVTAKNIDHSLVKAEINNLPSHKEDLIKGLEISNGTASLPPITNKLPVSTDGSILGTFVNGQFVPTGGSNVAGKWDYIVKTNGEIVVGRKHSWMSNGDDVLAAGEVKFNNGVLADINNLSGHYQPTPGEAMNFLRAFKNQGVNTDDVFLSMYKADGTIFKQVHPNANARVLYE